MAARQMELGRGECAMLKGSLQQCMVLTELAWGSGLVWRDLPGGGAGCLCHEYQQHPGLLPWSCCVQQCPRRTALELPHFPQAALVPYCQQPRPWALVLPSPSSPP